MGRYLEIIISFKRGGKGLHPEALSTGWRDMTMALGPTIIYIAAAVYTGVIYEGPSEISAYPDGVDDRRLLAAASYDDAFRDDTPIYMLLGACLLSFFNFFLLAFVVFGKWRTNTDYKSVAVPMNLDFVMHRYGEWIMLMLGESVLSLLIVPIIETRGYYATFVCGIISIILLEYLHFRSQPASPEDFVMRRSREAAFFFKVFLQAYSVALVVLGTTYKMLLYEFVYQEESSQYRMLLPMFSRMLAGGDSAALRFPTAERQQLIAHFFSGSMATVFFCLDVMLLLHKGLSASLERMNECHTWKSKAGGTLLILLRVGLIGMVASLSQYVVDPPSLALIGMCSVFAQLIIRGAGSYVFPPSEVELEAHFIESISHTVFSKSAVMTGPKRRINIRMTPAMIEQSEDSM
jgi:hypothetical protein